MAKCLSRYVACYVYAKMKLLAKIILRFAEGYDVEAFWWLSNALGWKGSSVTKLSPLTIQAHLSRRLCAANQQLRSQ